MRRTQTCQRLRQWVLWGSMSLVVIGCLVHAVQERNVLASRNPQDADIKTPRAQLVTLTKKYAKLSEHLDQLNRGDYIVVDTARNQLFLISNSQVVLKCACSTGSGRELTDPIGVGSGTLARPEDSSRSLRSKNPCGGGRTGPLSEEGERPPANIADRLEPGVLGDYALGFGDGYFIHGTLYTRLIGKNVTHGCIRLPDRELEALFNQVRLGTPLLIF